jgi:hypothetical protein
VSPFSVELSFPHQWGAEVLVARPLILPPRRFVYPHDAEEIERGALEVLVRPDAAAAERSPDAQSSLCAQQSQGAEPFLATCALGFRDPAVPSGLWSSPKPEELCAVSGGYAYLIDTTAPERFTMIEYRPVLAVRALPDYGLLLFVGHHGILAWGAAGNAWQSRKLSDEGVTIAAVESGVLRGMGWEMLTDKETTFALDVRTGFPVDR